MSGGKVLATDVHVQRDGEAVLLPAGKPIPAWASDQVQTTVKVNGKDVERPGLFAEAEPEAEDDESTGDEGELTVQQLKDALKERELPTGGTKPELLARLKAAEAEDDESTGDQQNKE